MFKRTNHYMQAAVNEEVVEQGGIGAQVGIFDDLVSRIEEEHGHIPRNMIRYSTDWNKDLQRWFCRVEWYTYVSDPLFIKPKGE